MIFYFLVFLVLFIKCKSRVPECIDKLLINQIHAFKEVIPKLEDDRKKQCREIFNNLVNFRILNDIEKKIYCAKTNYCPFEGYDCHFLESHHNKVGIYSLIYIQRFLREHNCIDKESDQIDYHKRGQQIITNDDLEFGKLMNDFYDHIEQENNKKLK